MPNPLYSYTMEKPAKWMSTNPLRHFCMVTYTVPPERVRPHIAKGLTLDTRVNDKGEEVAFVSAVAFLNDHIRLFPAKWPTLTFHQVSYRTYVHHKDVPGVWFFRLIQHSRIADFNRKLFGAPTFYAPLALTVEMDEAGHAYKTYKFNSVSSDHVMHLDAKPAPVARSLNGLFSSTEELEAFLTSRPDGYFNNQRKPAVTGLTIWHEVLQPAYATAQTAQFSPLSDLGLVTEAEQRTPFCIMLSPRTILLGHLPNSFNDLEQAPV